MKKGCFNMYSLTEKSKTSLYKDFKPRFTPKYRYTEMEVYIANNISKDITKKMNYTIKGMTDMVIQGLSERGD